MPVVPVVCVQKLQVIERSAGRGDHIAAAVIERGLRKLVFDTGLRDELPEAGGLRRRQRLRIETALDERQQGKLGGQPAALDLVDNVVKVAASAQHDRLHQLRSRRVPGGLLRDARAVEVGHRKPEPDSLPQVSRLTEQFLDRRVRAFDMRGRVRAFDMRGQSCRRLPRNTHIGICGSIAGERRTEEGESHGQGDSAAALREAALWCVHSRLMLAAHGCPVNAPRHVADD